MRVKCTKNRLPRGTIKTPEQKKARIKVLTANYRKKHRKELREQNRKYHKLYKETKPHPCCCIKCDCTFRGQRKDTKICDNCRVVPTAASITRQKAELLKRQRVEIIRLARAGVPQKDIATRFDIKQNSVSAYCVRHGIRRRNFRLKLSLQ